jgi:hypothetical protein
MPTVDASSSTASVRRTSTDGGESIILETVGFGGLSQAAACVAGLPGGSLARMMRSNEEMYWHHRRRAP